MFFTEIIEFNWSRTWREMFHKMLLRKIFDFNQFNRDMWVKEKATQIPRGSKVLDAGAGTGRYRHLFSHCDYKALDFCKEPSTIGHYTKMDFVCDVTSIPVPDESIDVILCTEVLEHVPEPIKVVKEFSRILKKGGTLLLTAPLGCGIHQQPFIYYGGFTPYWYTKFLGEYGFKDIKITQKEGFFKHYGQESRFISYIFQSKLLEEANCCFPLLKVDI